MKAPIEEGAPGDAGAYGVNYALRPHKFVDRRIFIEAIGRCTQFVSLADHVYVGLGSFAMEDHKLINASFGIRKLLSLEINPDVVERQKFNTPLSCIMPTAFSTGDFIVRKTSIVAFRNGLSNSTCMAAVVSSRVYALQNFSSLP